MCVIVLKFVNYRYNFVYPMFMAMVSESTWIVSFPLMFALARRYNVPLRIPTKQQFIIYTIIGFGFALSKTLTSYSETILPGSIFSIISSSDIVFNLWFSRLILKRKITRWHLAAIVLLIAGVLPNALSDVVIGSKDKAATDRAEQVTGVSLTLALGLAFIGIAEVSCNLITFPSTHNHLCGPFMTIVVRVCVCVCLCLFFFQL